MKKAVLLIHYYYPPIKSIAVVRNLELSKQWANWADKIALITTSNRNIMDMEDVAIPSTIEIKIANTSDYRTRTLKYNKEKNHFSEEKKGSLFGKTIVKSLNSFPINLIVGEGGRQYIQQAIKIGSLFLKENPKAIIYSSFRPFSDHYIASQLKKDFPNATWIADFRDLHLDPIYGHYYFKKYQQKEAIKIMKHADVITTVSNGLAKHLKYLTNNIHVLRNGVNIRKPILKKEEFTISYTGSLFGDERDPKPLLKSIQYLLESDSLDPQKINLIYAGKDGSLFSSYVKEFGLENIFIDRGLISREEALELQQSSHLNLLLSASTPEYTGIMTGKLYEYIGSLSKIILIIKGSKDEEFENLFETFSLGYIQYTKNKNITILSQFLVNEYNHWYETKESKYLDEAIIKSAFDWTSIFKKLIQRIEA